MSLSKVNTDKTFVAMINGLRTLGSSQDTVADPSHSTTQSNVIEAQSKWDYSPYGGG